MSNIKINIKKKKKPQKIKEKEVNENIKEIENYSIEKPKPKKLIINHQIKKTIKQDDLKYGVTEFKKDEDVSGKKKSVINQNQYESDPEEDEEQTIPVEEFGLAFLRGLGYNEEDEKKEETPKLENRQKGHVLGIGAKPIDEKS
ncbi:unnamed protein product [Candida verbasci]|uniref:Spp2/MOS2 G-patch domain-containing protein n=1 Tax=Candida verbasci TaxID=1227364 RepID=A0A9W4TSH7_9ASCO|nr:unnamed protein product [Candida verbasci]